MADGKENEKSSRKKKNKTETLEFGMYKLTSKIGFEGSTIEVKPKNKRGKADLHYLNEKRESVKSDGLISSKPKPVIPLLVAVTVAACGVAVAMNFDMIKTTVSSNSFVKEMLSTISLDPQPSFTVNPNIGTDSDDFDSTNESAESAGVVTGEDATQSTDSVPGEEETPSTDSVIGTEQTPSTDSDPPQKIEDTDLYEENPSGNEEITDVGVVDDSTQTQAKDGVVWYIIRRGDTLRAIAIKFNLTVESIARENNITNVDLIITGNKLRLPVSAEVLKSLE